MTIAILYAFFGTIDELTLRKGGTLASRELDFFNGYSSEAIVLEHQLYLLVSISSLAAAEVHTKSTVNNGIWNCMLDSLLSKLVGQRKYFLEVFKGFY